VGLLRYQKGVRALGLLIPVTFVLSVASVALAQEPSAADVKNARAAFLDGLDLRDNKHDLAAATVRLKAAYALVPTPRIGYELGRTLRQSGDLIGARAAFGAAIALPPRPDESAEAKRARTEAEAQVTDLEQRIPQLQLHVVGVGQIYVDGEPIRRDALATPRRLNPGSHVVQVQVEGDVKSEQTIGLREGEHKDVTMSASTQAQVTETAPPVQMVALPNNGYQFPITHRSNASTKAGLFYAAATIAGVGVVPGVFALAFVKAAQDACTNGVCDSSFASNKTLAYGFAIATDVLWGAALICAVAAIVVPSYSEGDVVVSASPLPGGGGTLNAIGRF
jgi:hypothetical protein